MRFPRTLAFAALAASPVLSLASCGGDAEGARKAYGYSIEYSMRSLLSFVARYGDDNLVLVVLGGGDCDQ